MYGGALPLVHSTFIVEEMRVVPRLRVNASRYRNRTHMFRSSFQPYNGTVNTTVYHKWLMQQKRRSLERSARKLNMTRHRSLNSTTMNRAGNPYSQQLQRSSHGHLVRSGKSVNAHSVLNNQHLINRTRPQRVVQSPGQRIKGENINKNSNNLL